MPLYRRLERGMQLVEFKCQEYSEEIIYGHLRQTEESVDALKEVRQQNLGN